MLVKLKKNTTTDYTVRPVTVEGTFYLKPYQGPDGNTWAIYRMRNATVK
jgi:predicted lactoylglutathione lyase